MSEHDEQVTFFAWVRLNREFAPDAQVRKAMRLCYAVPNGAHMSKAQAAKMKAEGLTKGILDINLDCSSWGWLSADGKFLNGDKNIDNKEIEKDDYNFAHYHGLRIEMKFGKNKLTPEQTEIKELLERAGFKVAVCYSAVEAVRAVYEYLPFEADEYQGIKEFL